jgi:hypothetical protein
VSEQVWGRTAYEAYAEVTSWKNWQGLPMPAWEDLPELIRRAWSEAAQAVREAAAK